MSVSLFTNCLKCKTGIPPHGFANPMTERGHSRVGKSNYKDELSILLLYVAKSIFRHLSRLVPVTETDQGVVKSANRTMFRQEIKLEATGRVGD